MIIVKPYCCPRPAWAAFSLALTPFICMVAFAGAPAMASAFSPPPGPNRVIILGKVLNSTATPSGLNGSYAYQVEVVCEFRGRVKPGTEARIEGPREMVRSEMIRIPVMASGSYFVMAVEPTGNQQLFRFHAPFGIDDWLPIGIKLPSPVAAADVADVRSALLKYRELSDRKKPIMHDEAEALRESRSYFLWALGTSAVAESASPQDVRSFLTELNVGTAEKVDVEPGVTDKKAARASDMIISLRQAVWLLHCLTDIVSVERRPSCDEARAAMIRYLIRFNDLAERNSFVP